MSESDKSDNSKNDLPAAAKRALAEAAARRASQAKREKILEDRRADEKGGPKAMEPVRYGDWERGGRAYDF